MSPLREAVADNLLIRRALGYKLDRAERLLGQFLDYLDAAGAKTVTIDHALAWALLPEQVSVSGPPRACRWCAASRPTWPRSIRPPRCQTPTCCPTAGAPG